MESKPDPEIDDDFSELYKEYTGPPGFNTNKITQKEAAKKPNKRSLVGSDDDEDGGARDPNAVPTDFTSREAKVWVAKSKATERNWKKRKEEEFVCKICGESGHFTQGCPSTLGANRKSQDFFERVPAREKHVRALFTEKVISRIEKDIGCNIKMDEKFIIVSGKDRLILRKGVDAVHKMIRENGEQRSSSQVARSRSPKQSPVASRLHRSESQRSHSGPRNGSNFQPRFHRQDKFVEDRIRQDMPSGSPQAYGNDGARGRPSQSNSPAHAAYMGNSYNSNEGHKQSMGTYRNDGWDSDKKGSEMQSDRQFDYPSNPTIPQTLEELELEYKREAMELGRIRDKEEDDENYKHREAIREMRENFMKKLANLRGMHAKQWENFLQLDAQRHQQQTHQQMPASGFGGYKSHNYTEYDDPAANPHYSGANLPMDSGSRYPHAMEKHPSRPHNNFGEFQRERHQYYGRGFNRY